MSNLLSASAPYLHSSPETFYNNLVRELVDNTETSEHLEQSFQSAISSFQEKKRLAQEKERQFYTFFKDKNGNTITTPQEWANAFLINKNTNADLHSVIQDIFNSPDMVREMMSLSRASSEVIEKRLATLQEAAKNTGYFDLFNECVLNSGKELEKGLMDFFAGLLQKNSTRRTDIEIFKPFLDEVKKNLSNSIRNKGKSRNIYKNNNKGYSNSIKQAAKAITRKNPTILTVKNRIIKILKIKLNEKGFDEKTIQLVINNFEELIKEKQINLSNLQKGDWSNTVGAVQEIGSGFSINLIQEQKDGHAGTNAGLTISAKSIGQELVQRANLKQKVDSKTDTLINIVHKKTNHKFRIQEKNSLNEIYTDLEVVDFLDKQIEQKFARMKVQDTTSLEHYYSVADMANGGKALEKPLISYVLVNFLLYSDSNYAIPPWREKRKMKSFKKGNESNIKVLIEQLLSLNSDIYFSDIYKDAETEATNVDTVDFIIYKNRFLIPMSYVYYDIIGFLQDSEKYRKGAANSKRATQLRTSFDFNFSKSRAAEMNKEKMEIFKEDSEGKNYSNNNLVNIGQKYGQEAVDATSIRSVQLDFDPRRFRNIIAQTFQG